MKTMNKLKPLALTGAVLLLSACQQSEDLPTSVTNRWNALTTQDYETAYGYFSPGYRETETLQSFMLRMTTAQMNVKWTSGTYDSSECSEEEYCEVRVNVAYEYSFPKRSLGGMDVETKISENWIKTDGKWYFVPKNK
jgi:outer membrane lipopolysaccharide assembly protein LptE/RlpB